MNQILREVPSLSLMNYINGTTSDQIKFVDDLMFGLKEYGFDTAKINPLPLLFSVILSAWLNSL